MSNPIKPISISFSHNLPYATLSSCNMGVIVVDVQKKIVIWNRWMETHANISEAHACGKTLEALYPALENTRVIQTIDVALKQGMSSILSHSLNSTPFELYFPYHINPTQDNPRLQQTTMIIPINFNEERYCLVQIMDVSHVVKREQLLKKQAEKMAHLAHQYHENENYIKAILNNTIDGIITTDQYGVIEICNPAVEKIFGYRNEELLAENITRLLPNFNQKMQALLSKEMEQLHFNATHEVIGQHNNGKHLAVELSINPMNLKGKNILICVIRDISQRKRIKEALIREKERVLITLASIGDGVITTDMEGCVQYMNPVAEKMTGWSTQLAQNIPLSTIFQVYSAQGDALTEDLYQRCNQQNDVVKTKENLLLLHRSGSTFYIEGTIAQIRSRDTGVIGIVIAFRDVTQAQKLAQQLNYQATHDPLTNLVNRNEFEQRANEILLNAKQYQTSHALCYLDLDQFKLVNDSCGHSAGDELLRQLSALLKTKLYEGDTLARLGGDEFGILLQHCNLKRAHHVAECIRRVICDFRFIWYNKTFRVGVSIGLVMIDENSENISSLLVAADTACYAAKENGRNCVWVHEENTTDLIRQKGQSHWSSRISEAIADEKFILYEQSIVPLKDPDEKNIQHIELMIRMVDEKNNIILPMAFIPAAERHNQMTYIDRWVIENALTWYATTRLKDKNTQYHMNINLSATSLYDKQLPIYLKQIYEKYNIPAKAICFEISETTAISHLEQLLYFIDNIKALECEFALDDFGSTLSSFTRLRNLPIQYIKIDGMFTYDLLADPVNYAMVESICHIAQVMGLKTIAKSVEDQETYECLVKIGVDFAQGFFIHKPSLLPLTHV